MEGKIEMFKKLQYVILEETYDHFNENITAISLEELSNI